MGLNKVIVSRKCIKWKAIGIVLLGLLNIGVNLGHKANDQNQRLIVNNGNQEMGKRNVLYNYVTDRPREPFGDIHEQSASPRTDVASLVAQKQHLARLLKYRQYLTKLYSKRRSDIDSPILQGDMTDFKDKDYENSPGILSDNQFKNYEGVQDINKKYGPSMVGLDYYTKDAIPTSHVMLPQQDYHSPIGGNLDAGMGYSQYSQARDAVMSQPVLSKDESDVERLIELEKLRELEELRGTHRLSFHNFCFSSR
jgi:hypothetical protein